jgi:UDP-2,3-diacylglucosamine pyrophosphatase LpxH
VTFAQSIAALMPGLPVVDLPPGSVVIADLHLDGELPEHGQLFESLLEQLKDAPVLVILGDLFEYWLGPKQAKLPGAARFLAAVRNFPGRLVFVPGNRDVLCGMELEASLGNPIFMNGFVGNLGGQRWLFLHGDELCIADIAYLRLRRILRSTTMRFLTRALARRLRKHSSHTVQYKKTGGETGQDKNFASTLTEAAGCDYLVVGHAHSFRETVLAMGGKWYVLDAFRGGPKDALRVSPEGAPVFGPCLAPAK